MHIIFWTGVFDLKTNYRAIGAYQLAWWMRSHDYECQVIDFIHHMTTDELIKYTEKFITTDTLCIGVSSTFWAQLHSTSKYFPMNRTEHVDVPTTIEQSLLYIKSKYPKIKFVLGGHSADFVSSDAYSLFDASIIGDAEDSFLELVNSWKHNKSIFHAVKKGGKPFINAVPNKIFNIQQCSHKFLDNDCIVPGEPLPIEISRGCIFRCTFCQYPHIGKTKFDYLRDFDKIGEEIEYNWNKFKTNNYYIVDDTFNDSDYKVKNWHNAISSLTFSINFTSYLRADLLHRNPEHIELLRQSGLMSCFFGIESFHSEASRLVGKGWSGKEAKIFLPQLKEAWKDDVTVFTSLIIGIPPESVEDVRNTQQWLIDNNMDAWTFKPLLITPGLRTMSSEFDRNYEKFGFTYNQLSKQWKTDYMSNATAIDLAKVLNVAGEKHKKVSTWMAISLLGSGVTKQELNTKKAHELNWKDIRMKQFIFINEYKRKLDSL